MLSLPRWFKRLYAWFIRKFYGDHVYAGLVENWHEKTVQEYYTLIASREEYRQKWFDWWRKEELDFLLTVPNAMPAYPRGGSKTGWRSCGYTFLFNLVSLFPYLNMSSHSIGFYSLIILLVFCQSHMSAASWISYPLRSSLGMRLRREHTSCMTRTR
jgi:hypothetical protein